MQMKAIDLAKKSSTLASLPAVFIRLNEAVNNPLSSVNQIARIISEDAGLSARLLHIANSALYQYPARIDNIAVAATVIGTEQLRDLALATSVLTIFKNIPADLVHMEHFWCHSIACGVAAKTMGAFHQEHALERFFLAGVLHDIGRLVIFQTCGEEARLILEKSRREGKHLFETEKEILGFDHAEVGGLLLERWKIPNNLVEMVSCHHDPNKAQRGLHESSLIHLADILVHAMQLGNSGERFVPAIEDIAWKCNEFSREDLRPIMAQVALQYDDLVETIFQ